MARKYEVDQHPDKEKIIKAVIKGEESLRSIAGRFGLAHTSLQRYVSKGLKEKAALALEQKDLSDGKTIITEIQTIMTRCRKMYDACDDYLTDPDNPDRYYLGPRADEIDVIYYKTSDDTGDNKKIKCRASLASLMAKIEDSEGIIDQIKSRHADPRELLLKTAKTLNDQLELIARIQGQLIEMMQVNAEKIIIAPMVINKVEIQE